MRSRSSYFFILWLVLLVSCSKKKYPESVVLNDAVYYTSFTVEGQPVSWKAGIRGYYMYSSFVQDSNGIYNFIADLKKTDCGSCPNALKIQINDFKISDPGAPVLIDSSIKIQPYSYLPQNAGIAYVASFSSTYNRSDPGVIYSWDFGDGSFGSGAQPKHTYVKAGKYKVCLSTRGSNTCVSDVCNVIEVGENSFNSSISGIATVGTSISFYHNTNGARPPIEFLWNFGDGQTSFLQNPTHSYPHVGAYAVSLRIIDAKGDTLRCYYNAVTKGDASSCAVNIGTPTFTSQSIPEQTLSRINLSYTDENGLVYQSNTAIQNAESIFEVVGIENGPVNENNEVTKKLHVKFSCKVASGNMIKTIKNGDAVICVAYK